MSGHEQPWFSCHGDVSFAVGCLDVCVCVRVCECGGGGGFYALLALPLTLPRLPLFHCALPLVGGGQLTKRDRRYEAPINAD